MNIIKLTIVIPTYNRKDSVLKQVRLLLPQLRNRDNVKLYVIDNCSPYNIRAEFTVNELQCFSLLSNPINIGGAANIARTFEMATSGWVWTLSDDDLVRPNSVDTVLNAIIAQEDCVMISFYDKCKSKTVRGLYEFGDLLKNPDVYSNFFWMSACVYNMDLIKDFMHVYYRALSTMQPGIVMVTRILQKDDKLRVSLVKENIIADAGIEYSWNRETFFFATLYVYDLLRDLKPILKDTMFDSIFTMNMTNISRMKNVSASLRLKYLLILVYRYGGYNALKNHFFRFLRLVFKRLFKLR